MKFACDSCQTKYTIPDEKVRGKVLKIRCKKCGAVITVREDPSQLAPSVPDMPPMEERTRVADIGLLERLRHAEQEEPTRAVAMPRMPDPEPPQHEWYVMISGQQVGPLPHDELSAKVRAGEINERSHVWRDGMADWKRAGEVDELRPLVAPPAPAPAPAARAPSVGAELATEGNIPAAARARPQLNDNLFGDDDAQTQAGQAAYPESVLNGHANGANGSAAVSSNLAGLLDDVDTGGTRSGEQPVAVVSEPDPFASVPDSPGVSQPAIGEQTRFFMKKAGVTNRNPWWKYALFFILLLALPVALVYGLGKAGVGGQVVIVDASGNEHSVPKFSLENVKSNGIGALLLGQAPVPAAPVRSKPRASTSASPGAITSKGTSAPVAEPAAPKANLSKEEQEKLAQGMALIGGDPSSSTRPSTVPSERKGNNDPAKQVDGTGDRDKDAIAKVFADNVSGFNQCVTDHLKRNPDWRGGKVILSVTIKPSGIVTEPSIDKPAVNGSEVGDCIKKKASRMHFPRVEGEDQTVEFPLVLTNGG